MHYCLFELIFLIFKILKTVSSIVCSAITSNAEFVSYSDVQATKLFRAHVEFFLNYFLFN
jgi:hypothetical protein